MEMNVKKCARQNSKYRLRSDRDEIVKHRIEECRILASKKFKERKWIPIFKAHINSIRINYIKVE